MCEAGYLEIATFAIQTIQQVDDLARKDGKTANHLTGSAFNRLAVDYLKNIIHGD